MFDVPPVEMPNPYTGDVDYPSVVEYPGYGDSAP
jgi:hypothetical protein